MLLVDMTKDYAQALLDVGFSICEGIGDSRSYGFAIYHCTTVSDLLEQVDENSVQFCQHWAHEKMWDVCSVEQAHMDAIGYAMYQALN